MKEIYCPDCGKKMIRRDVYAVLTTDGKVTVSFICLSCSKIVEIELKDLEVD